MVRAHTVQQLIHPMEPDERILQRTNDILDRSRHIALLNLLLASVHQSLEVDQVLKNALGQALRALDGDAGGIYLLDESSAELTLAFSHGFSSSVLSSLTRVRIGEGFIGQIVEEGEPVVARLTALDSRVPSPGLGREGFQLLVVVPLRWREQPVGALFLASRQAQELPPTLPSFLAALGQVIGAALEHARSYRRVIERSERERRWAAQLHQATQVGRHITLALGSSKLFAEAARLIHDILGYPYVSIFSIEGATEELVLRAAAGTFAQAVPLGSRHSLYQGMAGWVARHGEPLLANDVTKEPRFLRWYAETKAELDVPITLGGHTLGVLSVQSDRPFAFTADDVSLGEILAGYLAVGLHNTRLLEESQQRSDRLAQLERAWRAVVEALPVGFVLVHDEAIRYANRRAGDLTGYSPDELCQRRFCEIVAESCRDDGRLQSTPQPESPKPLPARLTLRGKDRHLVEVEVTRCSLLWEGEPAVALILRDVEGESRPQEQGLHAEKLAAIAQFVSGVAHELNSPLTSVVGYAELILSEGRLTEATRRDVEMIVAQAHRARKVVHNLLAFAQWYTPEKREININDVVEAALAERVAPQEAAHIRVKRDLAPDLPRLLADAAQLQQVFLNIIINAEQAMTEAHGGGTLFVQTRMKKRLHEEKESECVEIRFQDDGPGISPDVMRHIFDPFFTTKPPGVGTGLGLSICYGIVKEHGGDIFVLSREGEGATFIVELPIGGESQNSAPLRRRSR